MKKYLFILIALVATSFAFVSCSSDDDDDSYLRFTDIVGSYKITNISGSNSHYWLTSGKTMTFYSNGTCTTGFTMEDSWKNENGIIKTYCRSNNEPMFVYRLKSRDNNIYEVQMDGTLNENTSLVLTLQKKI